MRYWPYAVGGCVAPIVMGALAPLVPFPLAVSAAMFVSFAPAGWAFQEMSVPSHRRTKWGPISSGLAAGLA